MKHEAVREWMCFCSQSGYRRASQVFVEVCVCGGVCVCVGGSVWVCGGGGGWVGVWRC